MYRIPYENEQITKTIAAPYAPVDFTEEEKAQFRDNIGAGGGGGSSVTVTPIVTTGTNIADITVDGTTSHLYAPSGGGGGGIGRNLLDNGWFTVNQRSATTGAINAYFVDRWFGDASSAAYLSSITVNADKTVTITPASGQSAGIAQKFEDVSQITGKTVTASVMYADGTIDQGSAVFGANATFIDNANIYVAIKGAGDVIFFRPKTTKTLKAVKLELGSVSTLANDSAPNPATELMKCMRYFQRIGSLSGFARVGVGIIWTGSGAAVTFIPLLAPMRTISSVTQSGLYVCAPGGNQYNVTSIGYNGRSANGISVDFHSVSHSLSAGTPVFIGTAYNGVGYIDISADL